jgi:hypothetical protein
MKPVFKQAAAGAAAGAIAAFAMQQFVSLWDRMKGEKTEDGAFGLDREADVNASRKLWRSLFQQDLTEVEALKLARAMHYGYSIAASAGYAVLADRNPRVRAGFGTVYGAVLWLVGDEAGITLMGLSDPRSKTMASHLAALTAHLVFGSVTEMSRRSLLKDKEGS